MNTMLTAPVLSEEVRVAAFSIKEDSAPGTDGLTDTFYKRFWSIVGPNTVREVQSFSGRQFYLLDGTILRFAYCPKLLTHQ